MVLWFSLFAWPESRAWWEEVDLAIGRWFVDIRTDPLTTISEGLHALGSSWMLRALRWATLIVLIVTKRWRHLLAAVIVFVVGGLVVQAFANGIARPRPLLPIIGDWQGYSHPSFPVAAFSATLAVMGMSLIPGGRWRRIWFAVSGVLVALLVLARVYLGTDHMTDGIVGALFGVALAVVVFRFFAPDAVFPVRYGRGRTAHLDITGARGEAIRRAVSEQLGFNVLAMEPFGLEGSGGSTPIRLTVDGDPDVYLFAKLYSTNHLRADRFYKLWRTIAYGALEDEVRFTSVRRLVEYEDYMMLRMKEAGVPSAEPFGFVEITPEREYLIVTEFLQDAEEITTAPIDDDTIDDALLMIRRLWDAGLAHRDVKPANVMVKDGKVRMIDVAFGTIRPSPWRQAVDLANMMIILGLRSDPDHVYERALHFFAPEDIAEAFAATRSITIPSQSRAHLKGRQKKEGVDVVERFQALSPHREPIAIQRWSSRRIALAIGAAFTLALLISLVLDNLKIGGLA